MAPGEVTALVPLCSSRPLPLMAERPDARALNWRFVVPSEPGGVLLLPVDGERLAGTIVPDRTVESLHAALGSGPYPAVVAPDLGAWSQLAESPAALMRKLGAAVDRGGWLYAGFSNPLFPGRPLRRGSLRPGVVRRCLAPAGAWTIERFVTMPDQRCPAYILPAARRQELDYLLRTLFVPYTDKDGWRAQAIRRGLAAMRSVTLASPAPIRSLFAPAIAVVARRSS